MHSLDLPLRDYAKITQNFNYKIRYFFQTRGVLPKDIYRSNKKFLCKYLIIEERSLHLFLADSP